MKKFGLFFSSTTLICLTLLSAIIGGRMAHGETNANTHQAVSTHKEPMSPKPKHHTENGFQNYPYLETADPVGFLFYLRRFWHSIFLHDVPDEHFLTESNAIKQKNTISGDCITWIGHATFLIRISGKTILTDPFLTKFASPLSWGGPRRMLLPGISLDKLPPIDIILVSHDHFDHLDDETIRKLPDKKKVHVVVPLGLKPFFEERGYLNISELDWHDEIITNDIKLSSLPAVHNSGRALNSRNQTLWASWSIGNSEKKLLFVGDSAYSDTIFKKIGDIYGPFDYAILPIGAYEPREVMRTHHMNPKEAVIVGKEVRAATLVASHWGTINLSDEPPWEPSKRFIKAGITGGKKKQVWIMKIGETRDL